MSNLEHALAAERVVLSVMGPHAGENEDAIFSRKMEDIRTIGKTFWLYGSNAARPREIQSSVEYVLFISPATVSGARPTTITDRVAMFSDDNQNWKPLPDKLGPVTGRAGYALVLSELALCSQSANVDLWRYATSTSAVRFRLGASTLLVERKDTSSDPTRMKSRFRQVVAVGRLIKPYAVWLR